MICGESNTGKSTSLRNLKNREKYAYLNGDKKDLPIGGANSFLTNKVLHNPVELLGFYDQLEASEKCEGIILDTLTFMMKNFLRKTQEELSGFDVWNAYAEHYNLWNDKVKASNKTHIIMAHTNTTLNTQSGNMEAKIPLKGQVGEVGAEADQTIIVTSMQMPIGKLEKYKTPLLTFSEEERLAGSKYVFSTKIIKETVGDRTRSPFGMWTMDEAFIDNDIQLVLDRIDEFYS